MASLHEDGTIFLKGALEKVLERCHSMLAPNGDLVSLDRQMVEQAATAIAGQGLRLRSPCGATRSMRPGASLRTKPIGR